MANAEFQPVIQTALTLLPLVPTLFGLATVYLKWDQRTVKQVKQLSLSGASIPVENTGTHTIDESQIPGALFSLYTEPDKKEGFVCTIIPRNDPKGVHVSIAPASGGRVAAPEKKAMFLTSDSDVAKQEAIGLEVQYKP